MSRLAEFDSEGVTVRGWLYEPEGSTDPKPGVVMIHGFTATATGMVADRYAEAFADAGVAGLIIDPRGFGMSDGEPRHAVNEWKQVRDYRAGIDYLAGLDAIDPQRIAVWGDSISGGVALVTAAIDERVAAVVVQVPAFGEEVGTSHDDEAWFEMIRDVVESGDLDQIPRTIEGPLPVVSVDQVDAPSLIPTLTAFHWFISYGARYGTRWHNRATFELLDTPWPFEALPCMAHIDAPILMVVATEDDVPGADSRVARHHFELATAPKELFEIDGGHFGLLYHDSLEFNTAVQVQQEFLRRQLLSPKAV